MQEAHLNWRHYTASAVALVVVTIIEVILTLSVPETPAITTVLVTLSVIKILLVALFYMHLYSDNKLFSLIFLVPVPFVVLIAAALIVSYI